MSSRTWVLLHQYVPQRLLGKFIHAISRSRAKWIKTPLIGWFASSYEIDLSEAEIEKLEAYESLNAFFTRSLKPSARPIDSGIDAVVSPVDGRVTQFGAVRADRLLQAKGHEFGLRELLGEATDDTARLADGRFATIYLAPHDYHRVHMPLDGRLIKANYIAGRRFLVNTETAKRIPKLFCRNERLVCWFECTHGVFVMVLVGALNVASISTVAHGEIPGGRDAQFAETSPTEFAKGAEFGRFNLGSTVILLFERQMVELASTLTSGQTVRLGTRIGSLGDTPGSKR